MYKDLNSKLTDDQEPIIALCTPRGSGAIALLRLSGVGTVEIADSICVLASGKKLQNNNSHTIHFGRVYDTKQNVVVDEVLFLLMRAPNTFTGQDTVEITCHNNQFIIEKIINLACKNGARLARAGEFSKRSFLSGKYDLVQVEAINDVIHAQTEDALKLSMEQLQGSLSSHLKDIDSKIINLLTIAETSFEFLEEEQDDINLDSTFKKDCNYLLSHMRDLLVQFSYQQQLKNGVRVALVGRVNAGKSTLFNALVKKDRAIVADVAGTTRDSIELSIYKGGVFWTFIDTAGLRDTDDVIEQKGIERALNEAKAADVVLLVFDSGVLVSDQDLIFYRQLFDSYEKKIIGVLNKVDLGLKNIPDIGRKISFINVSAKHGSGISELEKLINEKIQILFDQFNSPYLLTQRQACLISEIEAKLSFVEKGFTDVLHYELIAYHLKESLEKISELTGKNVTEQVLDNVFNNFCVGK